MPRIAVVFTGGTISMRHEPDSSRNVPTLGGDELLALVPGLGEIAEIEPIDWGLVPASHLSFAQVLEIGRILFEALSRPEIDGAVVVQGTDVIEETGFAWDLLPLGPKPVVVVGAMRSASQEGYDGPENLRNAVAVAADPAMAGQGVVVAMAGDARVPVLGRRAPVRLPVIPERAALPVPIISVALEAEPFVGPASAAGLVVAAAGGGNTPPGYLDVARPLIALGG